MNWNQFCLQFTRERKIILILILLTNLFTYLCTLFTLSLYYFLLSSTKINTRTLNPTCSSVHITISWLWKFLVCNHLIFECNQALLHSFIRSPMLEHAETSFDISISLIYRWDIAFRHKLYDRRSDWIIIPTSDCQEVDAVVEISVRWPNNCAVPLCEAFIITFIESVWDTLVTQMTFFGFFKLFIKLECAWHYSKKEISLDD